MVARESPFLDCNLYQNSPFMNNLEGILGNEEISALHKTPIESPFLYFPRSLIVAYGQKFLIQLARKHSLGLLVLEAINWLIGETSFFVKT
jgi:hypothetical protein